MSIGYIATWDRPAATARLAAVLLPTAALHAAIAGTAAWLFARGNTLAPLVGFFYASWLFLFGWGASGSGVLGPRLLGLGLLVTGSLTLGAALGIVVERWLGEALARLRIAPERVARGVLATPILLVVVLGSLRAFSRPVEVVSEPTVRVVPTTPPETLAPPEHLAIAPNFDWSTERDVIAIAVDPTGRNAAVLRIDGRITLFGSGGSMGGSDPFPNQKIFETTSQLDSPTWLRTYGGAVIVGGGTKLETFERGVQGNVVDGCPTSGEGPADVSVMGRLVFGAQKLCLARGRGGGLFEELPAKELGCSRIEGLDLSFEGGEVAVQCERRVVVLDTDARRVSETLSTHELVPGSVRIQPDRILGVEKTRSGYAALVYARKNDSARPLATIDLGDPGFPPAVYLDAQRRQLIVAGNGLCYVGLGDRGPELGCMVPRSQKVRSVALAAAWTKLPPQGSVPFRRLPGRGMDEAGGFGLSLVSSEAGSRLVPVYPLMSLTP